MEMKRWAGERRETPLMFDTETTGLSPEKDTIRLIQLGDKHHGWAVPFAMWGGGALELLNNYEGRLGAHNRSFDLRFMIRHAGFEPRWDKIDDTLTMAHLLNPLRPRGLKALADRLVDPRASAGEQVLHDGMRKQGWTWATVPVSFKPYWVYGAADPVLTAHIWEKLEPDVRAQGYSKVYDFEQEANRICAMMMLKGMRIDVGYVSSKLASIRKFSRDSRSWLKEKHGVDSPMSGMQIADALGRLGQEIHWRTDHGHPQTDKEALAWYRDNPASPGVVQLCEQILTIRHAEKMAGTYFDNLLKLRDSNDIVHASIWPLGARTGRMCIAAGTMIDGPRDLVAKPLGTPIEDIRPGDDVYSFDESGTPRVRKVTSVHAHGTQRVMRLVYRRSGFHGGELMQIEATPDHRFALRTGEYRELRDLKPGDKLGFLMRTVTGRWSSLEWNGNPRVDEHRHICQSADNEVVHHINHHPLDQSLDNLIALTIKSHIRVHSQTDVCPWTRDELRELAWSGTNLKHIAAKTGYSYRTFMRWCRELDVEVPENNQARRAGGTCPLTASEFFARLDALARGKRGGAEALAKELGISAAIIRRWKREFEVSNHEVIAVIDEGKSLPVYDLTIDGTPNFVANELWVHNSITDPALQTLPRDDLIVRGAFIPAEGCVLISCDYDQIEMRLAAHFSADPGLIEAFRQADKPDGTDFFSAIASELFRERIRKGDRRRQMVKNMGYARIYGAGLEKMAITAGVTADQMRPVRDRFDEQYPGLSKMTEGVMSVARSLASSKGRPGVMTPLGRFLPGEPGREYALVNYLIQSHASEILKQAMLDLDAAGLGDAMLLPVHDEIVFEVPAGDAEEACKTIRNVMERRDEYAVPITCEPKIMAERWVGKN